MPALPLDEAGKYVAGAYVVFFALIALYIAIIGAKIARIERQVGELLDLLDSKAEARAAEAGGADEAPVEQRAPDERDSLEGSPR